jgi:acyl-CoA synthetase (AMP-forming)/AMP-acid ligase II
MAALTLAPALSGTAPCLPAVATLADIIGARCASQGSRPYLEHARSGRVVSFGELSWAVELWTAVLDRAGVAPGSTVALSISDPLDFSIAFLGTIAAGRWVAPLNPAQPAHGAAGLEAAAARVHAVMVFADAPVPAGVDLDWVHMRAGAFLGAPSNPAHTRPARRGDAGGAVLASSGTSGPPKVIRLGEDQLLHTARGVAAHHRLTRSDRGFCPLPLFHINAEVVGLLASLVAGSCLVLDDRFHRTRFWGVMTERRITWINAVPAIISRLADPRGEEMPPGIRFIRSASAPLAVATAARFEATTGIPVVETYGMTEAASQITTNPVDGGRKLGSVGLPVGVELRIVADETAMPEESAPGCPHGTGHVEIRGPSVITAYGGDDHRECIDSDGWLRTGDLGHLDDDGYLYLDARADDVINRGGEKVFPREIEEVALLDPDVAAIAVVAALDPELGAVPVAFLVVHGIADDTDRPRVSRVTRRVRDHLEVSLVRSKRPASLMVVRALPAGATGKVARRALRAGDVPVIFRLDCR